MKGEEGTVAAGARQRRRWRFDAALFDEGSWTLHVDGKLVQIESKPLEILRELLIRDGAVATRDELLDAVWPRISVVEASLTTAILKLRRALGDDSRDDRIIATVPRVGYRLAVPAELDGPRTQPRLNPAPEEAAASQMPGPGKLSRLRRHLVAATMALALVAIAFAAIRLPLASQAATAQRFTQRDARDALRELDLARIKQMLRAGWNPNTPFDREGNGALNILMNVCEWDRGHDREKLLLMARTLYDGGARLDVRNVWGDTPYSIAKAKRYCGPDHPVTHLIYTQCYSGTHPLGDKCQATRDLRQ